MSNKPIITMAFQFEGDGSTKSISVVFATAPISFFPIGGSAGTPSLLSSVAGGLPTDVDSPTASPTLGTVSAALQALGVGVDFTFENAPAAGTTYTVTAILEF
jgi:hypothetical protein